MKNDLIKIWVCRECEKEFLERPVMCTGCNKFEFYVKYSGQITDSEELTELIDTYKGDDPGKDKKRLRVR